MRRDTRRGGGEGRRDARRGGSDTQYGTGRRLDAPHDDLAVAAGAHDVEHVGRDAAHRLRMVPQHAQAHERLAVPQADHAVRGPRAHLSGVGVYAPHGAPVAAHSRQALVLVVLPHPDRAIDGPWDKNKWQTTEL